MGSCCLADRTRPFVRGAMLSMRQDQAVCGPGHMVYEAGPGCLWEGPCCLLDGTRPSEGKDVFYLPVLLPVLDDGVTVTGIPLAADVRVSSRHAPGVTLHPKITGSVKGPRRADEHMNHLPM